MAVRRGLGRLQRLPGRGQRAAFFSKLPLRVLPEAGTFTRSLDAATDGRTMTEIEHTVLSGEELRTCKVRRVLPGGESSAWETHTDLRGSPIGDKVLVWEYDRFVQRGARGRVRTHVQVMYCAEGWHSTGGTAPVPDDPELCNAIYSRKWRKQRTGEERFKRFWEFHVEHPVVWIVKTSAQERLLNRRLAYCELDFPAEYRPRGLPGSRPVSAVSGLLRDSAHVRQARSRYLRCCPGVAVITLGRPPRRARNGHAALIPGRNRVPRQHVYRVGGGGGCAAAIHQRTAVCPR